MTNKKKMGRPITPISGYKIKCGHRFSINDGNSMTYIRPNAQVYRSVDEANTIINRLVSNKLIRVWGGSPRAKLIPVRLL